MGVLPGGYDGSDNHRGDFVAGSGILADQIILDAFGHVSIRHPTHHDRYLMSRNLAPTLVTADDIISTPTRSTRMDDEDF